MPADPGRFINDYYEEGMYTGLVVRSTIEHGQILSISYPTIPPEITLMTVDSIPGRNELELFGNTMPLLASDAIHYLGEPILLLCGPDERDLVELIGSVEIRYSEEEPSSAETTGEQHVVHRREVTVGDVEREMSKAFQVIEGEYATYAQKNLTSDAQGAFAHMEAGRLRIVAPTQWPHHVRNTAAAAVGLPPERVVVSLSEMSRHKDSRIWYPSLVAAHAALLSQASGHAVKLVLRRSEVATAGPRRAPSRIRIRTALDKEGIPTAEDIAIRLDGGAFPLMAEELLDRAVLGAGGPYRNRTLRVVAEVVESNSPPMDAFLGLGLAQGAFASETHASRIAELSQTDPFTWKRDNLIGVGEGFAAGGLPSAYPPPELLDRVAGLSDFRRKHSAYEMLKKRRDTIREPGQSLRGIGLSVSFQGGGFHGRDELEAGFSVVVRLEADGKLLIKSSGVSIDGTATRIWQDSAWRILGIERKNIVCVPISTDSVPDSGPSAFSRNTTILDTLVERCCQTIARRRFRSGLPIEVKKSYRTPKAHRWSAETLAGMPFATTSWAAAVVETELDPVTFETDIRGIWMTVFCGELLNPAVARETVENGVFHALWWCSSTHGSLQEPRFTSIPPLTIEFITPETRQPSGGVEELAGSVVPSAYVSAVAQATGRYFDSLPITPELIHRYTEDL